MPASAFHDVQFPTNVSYGATGGPSFKTQVTGMNEGWEQRNIEWDEALMRWNCSHQTWDQDRIDTLLAFFWAREGKAFGFRFRDWSDWYAGYKSGPGGTMVEEPTKRPLIGTGDGATTVFQLVKHYASGGVVKTRRITRPVAGSVKIYQDGVSILPGGSTISTSGASSAIAQRTSSTFSGWGAPIGPRQNFAGCVFDLWCWNAAALPTQVQVRYYLNDRFGTLLQTATVAISGAAVGAWVTVTVAHPVIANAAATPLWIEFCTDGHCAPRRTATPLYASPVMTYTTSRNIAARPDNLDAGFNPYIEFRSIPYTVSTTGGAVTFAQAPPSGTAIHAAYQFDVPARFDTDEMQLSMERIAAGAWPNIPIVGLKE